MEIQIDIEINEEELRAAIVKGYLKRTNQLIAPEDITDLENIDDFVAAIPFMALDADNTNIDCLS